MNKEEIERYKIRDYYMIPIEIVDSIFYSFEQENQKYKEAIDKANNWVRNYMDEWSINDETWQELNELLILLEEVE